MQMLAMIFNMIHLMYYQLTLHFDFYPFNNIQNSSLRHRMVNSVLFGALMLFPLVALRMDDDRLIEISSVILFLLLAKEFLAGWTWYFGSPFTQQNKDHHLFLQRKPAPDPAHRLLKVFTLLSFLSIMLYQLTK